MIDLWRARSFLWTCVALALGAAGCAHHPHSCGLHRPHAQGAGGIYVTGSGEAKGKPDLARTNVGIEVRAATVQQATEQANAQIANVLKVLKSQGIADTDLRTHGFSVSYDREYVPPRPLDEPAVSTAPAAEPAPKGARRAPAAQIAQASAPAPAPVQRGSYVVTNMVEVTIRNLDKLGEVLGSVTAAGANNVWGISFDIDDKRPLIEQARAQAVERAKADAARVAALSGLTLGPIVEISDAAAGGVVRPEFGGAVRAQSMDVPVERGEMTITHHVTLRYAIASARDDAPADPGR
jgi:uncharacterized protein YggE